MIFGEIDAWSQWRFTAYDKCGMPAVCDICGEELTWHRDGRGVYCSACGREMDRGIFFNHIGAQPGARCVACFGIWPLCREDCFFE